MDFLQELGSHRGGLVLLKTKLFWYGGRGWDGITGRVCLLLDAAAADDLDGASARATGAPAWDAVAGLLLVDGAPHWIWVAQSDVELL